MKKEREKYQGEEKTGGTVKAVGSRGREKEGGCHPWLPLITHSLMTLFFFPFSRFFSTEGGGGGGSPSGAQSNGVIQSSHGPGGTVLHQRSVCMSP